AVSSEQRSLSGVAARNTAGAASVAAAAPNRARRWIRKDMNDSSDGLLTDCSLAARATLNNEIGGQCQRQSDRHQDEGQRAAERPVRLLREFVVDQRRPHLEQ